MKALRILLACGAAAATLAAVVVLIAIAPPLQTWAARRALSGTSGVQGTLGSLSAGFGEVDIDELHLQADGAALTLPSLRAKLSLTNAVVRRNFAVRSLVAKGWTLDLTGMAAAAQPGAAPAQRATRAFLGLLGALRLPVDGSLDGVDLEGDVLFTPLPGRAPARVHVVVSGGGLGAGREGALAVDASGTLADPSLPITSVAARGSVSAALDSSRAVTRLRVDADLTDSSGSSQRGLTLAAQVTAYPAARAEVYSVTVSRAGREKATIVATLSEETRTLTGTWKVDVLDSDVAPYLPDHPLPPSSLTGSGGFGAGADSPAVRAFGSLALRASHLGVLSGALEAAGAVTLGAEFDVTRSGTSVRVDRLGVSLAGERPVATVKSVQPFSIDERSGALSPSDPGADLLDATVVGLPLAWLSGLTGGVAVAGGDAAGEFAVRDANGSLELRPKAVLTAAGVTARGPGGILAQGVDLGLSLSGGYSPQGWRVRWAPLTVSGAGRRLATAEGTASVAAGADKPVALAMKWEADLDALAGARAAPELSWLSGRSASGSLTATVGAAAELDAKADLVGHDPGQLVSASVHADVEGDGALSFKAPIRLSSGKSASEVSLEGSSGRDSGGPWIDVRLSGASVGLGHLRMLAAPFAPGLGAARDRAAFWGDWTGRVTVSLDRVRTDAGELADVGGVLNLDHGSIKLEGGRGGPAGHSLTNVTGSLDFNPASDIPYSLRAVAAATSEDAASLLPAPRPGADPPFEGKFTTARTFTGNGRNLGDLARNSREEFRITSTIGIVRILKADVADSLQEAPTPAVSDALATVGSVVGAAVGTRRNVLDSGRTKLSPETEAALDLTYEVAEIGYDSLTISAFQGSDGVIHLAGMDMVSPEVRLEGTGRIAGARGLALSDQALSADLQLGAKGKAAELLGKAGLLSSRKDDLGYSELSQGVHFGGTLAHLDTGPWSDLLVKAATRKPEKAK